MREGVQKPWAPTPIIISPDLFCDHSWIILLVLWCPWTEPTVPGSVPHLALVKRISQLCSMTSTNEKKWKTTSGKSARTGPTMPGSVPQLGCPAFLAASLTVPGESRLACTHQPARTRETREPRQPQPCVTCVAFIYLEWQLEWEKGDVEWKIPLHESLSKDSKVLVEFR